MKHLPLLAIAFSSFSALPLLSQNLIDSTTITATTDAPVQNGNFGPEHTLDGLTEEGFRNVGDGASRMAEHQGSHWISGDITADANGDFTGTITYDLGAFYDIAQIEILNTSNTAWNDRETDSFTIETSTNGGATYSAPSAPLTLQDYTLGFQTFPLTDAGVSHIRLTLTNLAAINVDEVNPPDPNDPALMLTSGNDRAIGLNEVRFYSTPAADTDNDGLPDSWEITHFGDLSHLPGDDEDLPTPDGLTNLQEFSNQTNPLATDTDGDTLSDGEEVNTHNTNPNLVDTDGDTLSDSDEINTHSSDPTLFDTDGDTLSDGDEVNTHMTLPNNEDTDGDGINDNVEINDLMTDPLVPDARAGLVPPSGITATADTTQQARFDVQNLVDDRTLEGFQDGDPADPDGIRPAQHQDNHWMSADGAFTALLTFDLGGTYDLTYLDILNTSNTNWNDAETNTLTIATSTDGGTTYSTPTPTVTLQGYLDGFQTIPLVAAGVTHVQINVEHDTLGEPTGAGTNHRRVGLNEVRFYTGASPLSALQIVNLDYTSGDIMATIEWNSIPGAKYLVEYSDDLENWFEAIDGEEVDASADATTTFTVDYDPAVAVAKRFFRVTRIP